MKYTDGIHLVADTLEELHEYAGRMGVKKCWFEGVKKGHPHYDISRMKAPMILSDVEVVHVRPRDILMISKEL